MITPRRHPPPQLSPALRLVQALAAFVAVNTLIYAALSLAKLIPRKRA